MYHHEGLFLTVTRILGTKDVDNGYVEAAHDCGQGLSKAQLWSTRMRILSNQSTT